MKYSKKILFYILRSFFFLPTARFLLLFRRSSEVFCYLLRKFLFSSKGTPFLPKAKCANNIQKNVIRRPLSANNLLAVPARAAPVTVFVLVHFVLVRRPPLPPPCLSPHRGGEGKGKGGGAFTKRGTLKFAKADVAPSDFLPEQVGVVWCFEGRHFRTHICRDLVCCPSQHPSLGTVDGK